MRKSKFVLLSALAIVACSKDEISENSEPETQSQINEINESLTEEAYPGETGPVSEIYYAGHKIPVENHNGEFIYQGDIKIPSNRTSKSPQKLVFEKGEKPQQKSTGRTSGRWEDNKVYYSIDGSLSNKDRVHDAIKHWESNTNLEFIKRTSQSDYIYFTPGSGCSSYVGRIGGKQDVTLSSVCSTGNTIHEIGHAIGLWHEQSRVDRDSYITIHYDNVRDGAEHNFHTYEDMGYDGEDLTSKLDLGSIMMYGAYSFSSNGEPTITKSNGSTYGVQRSELSSGDLTGINKMYPAGETAPEYVDGEFYTIEGVTVLRFYGSWYYEHSRLGYKQVELIDGTWYWA